DQADRSALALSEGGRTAHPFELFRVHREEVDFIVVAVPESKLIIKDEVHVVHQVQHHGEVVEGDELGRGLSEVLVHAPNIQWGRKKTSLAPLEGLRLPALMPHRRFTLAVENENGLFHHASHWARTLSGGELKHVSGIRPFSSCEVNDCGANAQTLPALELYLAHSRNVIPGMNWDTLGSAPLIKKSFGSVRLERKCFLRALWDVGCLSN